LAYPKPALFSTPSSLITSAPQPQPTYAGYGKDLKKLHRLEGEVEDLQKRYSDVQRDVGLLTQQDEQDRGRSSRHRPPPAPPADHKADQHRLRREEDYKKAAADKAHNDAKRVEVEVKRQVRCDDIEDKRKGWWHKNKQRTSPVHWFPVTPATTAKPVTSFTTTLACRPGSSASQNSSSSLAVAPPVPTPSPPSKIPLPNRSRSRSCSRSAERDAVEHPVRSCDRPALKGILVQKVDGQTREPQTPLKFLRFSNSVKVARIVDEPEDGDGDGGSSGGDGGGEEMRKSEEQRGEADCTGRGS
jgi:hypothetical protein